MTELFCSLLDNWTESFILQEVTMIYSHMEFKLVLLAMHNNSS